MRYPWVRGTSVGQVDSGAHLRADCAHMTVLELTRALAAVGHGWEAESYHAALAGYANDWWHETVPLLDAAARYGAIDLYLEPHPTDEGRVSVCPREAWEELRRQAVAAMAARGAAAASPRPAPIAPRAPDPEPEPEPEPAPEVVEVAPPPSGPEKSGFGIAAGLLAIFAVALAIGKR